MVKGAQHYSFLCLSSSEFDCLARRCLCTVEIYANFTRARLVRTMFFCDAIWTTAVAEKRQFSDNFSRITLS